MAVACFPFPPPHISLIIHCNIDFTAIHRFRCIPVKVWTTIEMLIKRIDYKTAWNWHDDIEQIASNPISNYFIILLTDVKWEVNSVVVEMTVPTWESGENHFLAKKMRFCDEEGWSPGTLLSIAGDNSVSRVLWTRFIKTYSFDKYGSPLWRATDVFPFVEKEPLACWCPSESEVELRRNEGSRSLFGVDILSGGCRARPRARQLVRARISFSQSAHSGRNRSHLQAAERNQFLLQVQRGLSATRFRLLPPGLCQLLSIFQSYVSNQRWNIKFSSQIKIKIKITRGDGTSEPIF